MKITDVRTRVVEWRGKTVPPQPHFCTNPMDVLDLPSDSMGSFRFYGWLIVEVFTDTGLVGIGNAALSPRVTKQLIDLYLKPLLIGRDPFDTEFLWQHMKAMSASVGRDSSRSRSVRFRMSYAIISSYRMLRRAPVAEDFAAMRAAQEV